ncbi:DUF2325 domain-containing protein [Neopusillimonas aromaticivorans]|uniref:DUF2325 domain-containing protein n=1 Tax=Neopusillimonas aromaticivorans TaxID=2979868 RepID=UPI003315B08B
MRGNHVCCRKCRYRWRRSSGQYPRPAQRPQHRCHAAHQRPPFRPPEKTPQLPTGADLLILLTDFLGHNVMKTFRAAAQRSGVRVVACRRSVCCMKQALSQCGYCEGCPSGRRTHP